MAGRLLRSKKNIHGRLALEDSKNSSNNENVDVGNLKCSSRKRKPELPVEQVTKQAAIMGSTRKTRSGKHYTSMDIIDEVVMCTSSETEADSSIDKTTTHDTTPVHDTSTPAHDTSTQAHDTSTLAHDTSTLAHDTSTPAHDTSTLAHDTSTQAHDTSTPAHDTSRPDKSRYPLRNKVAAPYTEVVDRPIIQTDTPTDTVSPRSERASELSKISNNDEEVEPDGEGDGMMKECSTTSLDEGCDEDSSGDKESMELAPMETPSKLILGRQKLVKKLLLLMGKHTEWAPPSLFIYGEEAVGKTLVIRNLLPSNSEIPVGYVSLKECYTLRILFESILNSLSGVVPSSSNRYIGYTRCDHLPQFIKELHSLIVDRKWEEQTTYIVLDDFDWILNMEHTVCLSLIKLAEMTNLNLCVIAVSRCLWEKYDFPFDTIHIHFPQYSKEEVHEILLDECPPEVSRLFYKEFLNQVWNLVHPITRNIKELKYMCSQLFPIYREPIESGQASEKDSLKLWNHIRPYCQHYLSHTYTRNIVNLKNSRQNTVQDATPFCSTLPYFTKYLLIASYLSSYNPSKCDQRFFSEKRSKKNRSKGTKKKESETKRQLIGPRPFSVDRMLTIFSSVIGRDLTITAPLLMQIPTLVSMGLLAKVSQGDVLDIVRYKCMVTFEVIHDIAKSLDFEIVRFLYDYN